MLDIQGLFTQNFGSVGSPAKYCRGRAKNIINLRIHFVNFHMQEMIVILEESNRPHTCCLFCEMCVPWEALNICNPTIDLCARVVKQKQQSMAEEEAQAGNDTAFRAYVQPLETVAYFCYLDWILTAKDDYCPSVIGNIQMRGGYGTVYR